MKQVTTLFGFVNLYDTLYIAKPDLSLTCKCLKGVRSNGNDSGQIYSAKCIYFWRFALKSTTLARKLCSE
jgi:hypothetical protein